MLYKNEMVAVIKSNGKILREKNNIVFLPFGAEYSIYMKNLRSKKARVKVSIDGQDVLDGYKLIIDGNSELSLDCFLEDKNGGNHKFRFIQKTEKIQEYRDDKIDDGIIRIEFQYEREVVQLPIIQDKPFMYTGPECYPEHSILRDVNINKYDRSISCNNKVVTDGFDLFVPQSACDSFIEQQNTMPLNDEGITVKGSKSTQKFTYGNIGVLEDEKHVITLQIKGEISNSIKVSEAITVKDKIVCQTCGTKNNSKNNFCSECGTALK